jgi:hypothetical protein
VIHSAQDPPSRNADSPYGEVEQHLIVHVLTSTSGSGFLRLTFDLEP